MTLPVDLRFPFEDTWLVQNSPANRVPSHGTTLFGTAYAIDFVPVDPSGKTAPITLASLLRPESPDRFPGFGRPVLAPIDGVVVALHDGEIDHDAYRGMSSIGYAVRQRGRLAGGWKALAGNHVMIEAQGVVIALCHLRNGSIERAIGQRIGAGELIGRCGNSGNSTEPHLHLQAIDSQDVERASAVPITFQGELPRNGEIVRGVWR